MKIKNSVTIHKQNNIRTIATGILRPSQNEKTGDLLQIAHIVDDTVPTQALKTKKDIAVCGNCPLRKKTCYVNPVPLNAIYKATDSLSAIGIINPKKIRKGIRWGMYGDTVLSLPLSLVEKWARALDREKLSRPGYTHQWQDCDTKWSNYLMASIDPISAQAQGVSSLALKQIANSKGYRTYRISIDGSDIQKDEIICPHTTHNVQCADCNLCNGKKGENDKRKNIVGILHGAPNKVIATLKELGFSRDKIDAILTRIEAQKAQATSTISSITL